MGAVLARIPPPAEVLRRRGAGLLTWAVLVSLPVLLFAPTLAQYRGLGWAQHADEVAVALLLAGFGVRCAVARRWPRLSPGLLWIGGYLALGLLSGLVAGVPLWLMAASAALSVKGWLLALVFAQVDWRARNLRLLVLVAGGCAAFTFAVSAVNLVAPGWVTHLAGAGEPVYYRWALPSLIGPFIRPIAYGTVLALATGVFAALALTTTGRLRRYSAWGTALAAVGAVLSSRRLSLLAVVVAGALLLLLFRSAVLPRVRAALRAVSGRRVRPWVVVTAASAVAAAVVGVGAWRLAQSVAGDLGTGGESSARAVLTRGAFSVAGRHFPLGAGLGRYGSYLAGKYYSPEYGPLGFPKIWGLRQSAPNNAFLTDTFWPAVLGEAGVIGLIAYVIAVVAVFRYGLRLYRGGTGPARTVGLMVVLVWAEALILSAGGAVLSAVPLLVVPFVVLGVATALPVPAQRRRRRPW